MDNLTYRYKLGKNQLEYVDDAVTSATNANDIKDQASNNYSYNKIGQLVSNAKEGTTYTYNASGLVTKVQMGANSVEFFYDDRGQRIKKVATTGGIVSTSFYVRDAAGNAVSIYTGSNMEHTIFGASRIGVAKRTIGQTSLAEQNYFYELTDHLGNVRAVVQKQTNGNILAIAKTDYYPFGMVMPGRDVKGDYRYSYQGQEKDSETGMEAFELRLWDARIGRWLTTDPFGQYSSPYVGMGNDPINGIDPDGGYKTRFGAIIGWAVGGLKGKIVKSDDPATQYHKFGIMSSSIEGGVNFNVDFGGISGNLIDAGGVVNSENAWFFESQIGEASEVMKLEFWRNKHPESLGELIDQVAVDITYGTVENFYGTFSGKRFSGSELVGFQRVDAGVNTISTILTAGYGRVAKGSTTLLKSSVPLYRQFSKSTAGMFNGANHNLLRAKAYKEMIRQHNLGADLVSQAQRFKNYFKNFSRGVSAIENLKNN